MRIRFNNKSIKLAALLCTMHKESWLPVKILSSGHLISFAHFYLFDKYTIYI